MTIVIIGSGHNGLIAAFYLARAGHRPIVLERRPMVGGAAVTEELAPGMRCPTLAHALGPLRPAIVRDLQLDRRVEIGRPDPRLIALSPDGRALTLTADVARTVEAIRPFSAEDAGRYPELCRTLEKLASFLAPFVDRTPPAIDASGAGEVWDLLKTGRRFRALGRTDAYRLLRWMPMAVADLVAEWCSSDLLQAAIAARGIFGTAAGPWSAGTGAAMLLNSTFDPAPGGSLVSAAGGPGAVTAALAAAAREAGATIRLDAPVAAVNVVNGRAVGVTLEDGSELASEAVVSNVDPRRTFLDLVDPAVLDPTFLQRIRNFRASGISAKVNLALGALPEFTGVGSAADLRGRIHIGPSIDYLERAFDASKYGEVSEQPYLDVTIPSLVDPSLCPPGKHVMSIYMQYAPYKLAKDLDWRHAREQIGSNVMRTLERYSPGISALVEHRQIVTPADLADTYGLSGGHILHGEHAIDQLFTMRPVLGWAQYRTPIDRLFLCGAGTHPGGGLTGAPGRNAALEIARSLKR